MDEEQQLGLISEAPSIIKRSPTIQSSTASIGSQSPATPRKISIRVDKEKKEEDDGCHLTIPKVIGVSSSSETLTGKMKFRKKVYGFLIVLKGTGNRNHRITAIRISVRRKLLKLKDLFSSFIKFILKTRIDWGIRKHLTLDCKNNPSEGNRHRIPLEVFTRP